MHKVSPNKAVLDPTGRGYSYEYQQQGSINWGKLVNDLIVAHVMQRKDRLDEFFELSPWNQQGSETYVCRIKIRTSTQELENCINHEKDVIIKAIIKSGTYLTYYLTDWEKRSKLLNRYGITTGFFGVANGCVFQEYMEISLYEKLKILLFHEDIKVFRDLINKIHILGYKLGSLGFHPISLLPDLRLFHGEIALVDLGEDLGSDSKINTTDFVQNLLLSEIMTIVFQNNDLQEFNDIVREVFHI